MEMIQSTRSIEKYAKATFQIALNTVDNVTDVWLILITIANGLTIELENQTINYLYSSE